MHGRVSIAILGSLLFGAMFWGCSDDCACPLGTTCASDGSCVGGCTSDADCPSFTCDQNDPCCSERGVCNAGSCGPELVGEDRCGPPPAVSEGWDDLPGTGVIFVMNRVQLMDKAIVNIDGRCDANGCEDNAIAPLGALANDQIRQSLLGGEMLYALEISGLDPDYNGFDRSVTVKGYPVRDFDDPFFPSNNFRVPPGHTECCMFTPLAEGLAGSPAVAKIRFPAQLIRGRIVTVSPQNFEAIVPRIFYEDEPVSPYSSLSFELGQITADLPLALDRIDEVIISAAVRASATANICNPYCRTTSPRCPSAMPEVASILDLIIAYAGQPDIDLDGDGLECFFDVNGSGTIDRCCDGASACDLGSCEQIPASGAAESCTQSPEVADGHSVSLGFSGVPATFP